MRCIIAYYLWEGSRSTGSIDFGVTNEDDPRIQIEKDKLTSKGNVIYAVRFW